MFNLMCILITFIREFLEAVTNLLSAEKGNKQKQLLYDHIDWHQ